MAVIFIAIFVERQRFRCKANKCPSSTKTLGSRKRADAGSARKNRARLAAGELF
jgi:hypothetical protein